MLSFIWIDSQNNEIFRIDFFQGKGYLFKPTMMLSLKNYFGNIKSEIAKALLVKTRVKKWVIE